MKILLLKGLGREKDHWPQAFLTELANNNLEPLLIDLPGNGEFHKLASPLRIEDYAEFVKQQLDLIVNKNEEVFLLGHSLGGMVALRLAFEYPYKFKKVFLMNTSDRNSFPLGLRLKTFGLKKMFHILATKDLQGIEQATLELNSNNTTIHNNLIEEWVSIAARHPVSIANITRQLIASSKFESPRVIDTDLVYLSSKADQMVSYKCSKKLSELHKAPLKLHTTSGHDISLDDPLWLVEQIKAYL